MFRVLRLTLRACVMVGWDPSEFSLMQFGPAARIGPVFWLWFCFLKDLENMSSF